MLSNVRRGTALRNCDVSTDYRIRELRRCVCVQMCAAVATRLSGNLPGEIAASLRPGGVSSPCRRAVFCDLICENPTNDN